MTRKPFLFCYIYIYILSIKKERKKEKALNFINNKLKLPKEMLLKTFFDGHGLLGNRNSTKQKQAEAGVAGSLFWACATTVFCLTICQQTHMGPTAVLETCELNCSH